MLLVTQIATKKAPVKASMEATSIVCTEKTSGHSVDLSRERMESCTETVVHVYLPESLDFHHRNEHAGGRSRKTYIKYICVENCGQLTT